MEGIGDLVSNGGKKLLGVAAVYFMHMGISYYFTRKQPASDPQNKQATCPFKGPDNSGTPVNESYSHIIENDSPLTGKSKQLVRLFCQKLAQDPILVKYFDTKVLSEESLYSVTLEKYLLVNFGETYVQMPIDLRQKHKGMKIPKDHFWRWVHLLQNSMKELGITDKPQIWNDLEEDIIQVA